MDQEIEEQLAATFAESDLRQARSEVASITLGHVMAQSATNLRTAQISVIVLSKGNLQKLQEMVRAAKSDFRDVIYWASMEHEKNP